MKQNTHFKLNHKVNHRVSNYLFVWQIIQQKRFTTSKQTEAPRPRNLILKWSQTGMWFVLLTFVSFVPGIVCLLCFPLCYLLNHHQRLPRLSLFQSTGWSSFANLINSSISCKLIYYNDILVQYKVSIFPSCYFQNRGYKTKFLEQFLKILRIMPTWPSFFIRYYVVYNGNKEVNTLFNKRY